MSRANNRSYFWPLTSLVLALALVAGIFFWLSQSTVLAVETIEISGNHVLSDEQVRAIVSPRLQGQSLLKFSYDDVGTALRELPFVKEVVISRDFPHTIHVEIFEYRPVACYATDDGRYFLADDGRVLSIAEQSGTSLPVLTTRESCAADVGKRMDCADVLTGVDFIISVPVNLHQEFTKVAVTDGVIDTATLSGIEIHFGTMDEYAYKFEVLRQLIARTVAAGEQVIIDISVPDRPVTRPKNAPLVTGTTAAAGVDDAAVTAADEVLYEEPAGVDGTVAPLDETAVSP